MLQIQLKFNKSVLKVIQSDKAEITIGRNAKNDIQIDNLAVSNFHARVLYRDGQYSIEDLNSTNGTYINEKRIDRWDLQDGDTASIGKHSLIFLLEGGAGAGAGMSGFDMDQTMMLDTEKQRELLEKAKLSSSGSAASHDVQEGEISQEK
ncbi:MAG: FHA domain-containing protein [Desulforhopalus sp.]